MKSFLCSLFRADTNPSCSFLSPLLLTGMLWLGIVASSLAQGIDWQKVLGGSKNDSATAIIATPDGGYIVAGSTASNDGDVTGSHGGKHDAWVVKLNSTGSIAWKKAFGGSGDDQASAITASPDGGFVVTGISTSADGDMADFRPTWTPGFDYIWVFKLNSTGDIVWKQAKGFSRGLYATAITAAPGGGYTIAGHLFFSGTKNTGRFFYVLNLSEAGNVVWDSYFGGRNGDDLLYAIAATADGGYVLAGKTSSPVLQTNSLTEGAALNRNHNSFDSYDAFVIKLNNEGKGVWHTFLGGRGLDYANAITSTPDGGLLVAGFTMSTDGDVGGNHGGGDAWVVKLSSSGGLIWQKVLGGSGADNAFAITSTGDGGFVIAGTTDSNDGDVSGVRTNDDGWLVKLNSTGQLIGQKPYGGNGSDGVRALLKTADGGYVTAGFTRSTDGPMADNHGDGDAWVVKLGSFSSPGLLTLLAPTYSCQTGAIVFNVSGGDGSPIVYTAPGIIRSTTTDRFGTVESELRSDPKPLSIQATQLGETVVYIFDFGAYCSGLNPTLTLLSPGYNCATGAIRFNTDGGDGSPIEFMAVGITAWTTNPDQFLDTGLRTASDVQPFTLLARQSGRVVSYSWNLKVACGRSRVGRVEQSSELSILVLGNPVSEAFTVEIGGAEGQSLGLRLVDGQGRLVDSRSVSKAGAIERQYFDLPQQGPGLLFLRINSDSQRTTVKILKL